MKLFIADRWFVVALGIILLETGCGGSRYYMVKDPQSNKVYYTEEVKNLNGGSVQLKDTKSGHTVTLHNSEVKEIDSKEYQQALKAPVSQAAATSTHPAQVTPPTPAHTATESVAPAPAESASTPAAAPAQEQPASGSTSETSPTK